MPASLGFRSFSRPIFVVILGSLLVSCGGGGGDDDSGPPQAFSTPESVLKSISVTALVQFMPLSEQAAKRTTSAGTHASDRNGTIRDPAIRMQQGRHIGKAAEACQDGGTFDQGLAVERQVNSPFSEEIFLVEDQVSDECRSNFDDGTFVVNSGPETFGCPASQSLDGIPCNSNDQQSMDFISYSALGRIDEPFEQSGERINVNGDRVVHQNSNIYVAHERDNNAGIRDRFLINNYTSSESTDGGPMVNAEGYVGTDIMPRVIHEDRTGSVNRYEISGAYGFSGDGCDLGEFELTTTQVIEYVFDESPNGRTALSGRVQVVGDGRTASAQINSDGSLSVTDADGDSKTYFSANELRQALGGCLQHAF